MSDITLNMGSAIVRKPMTKDHEIVIEVKNSSLWVVWVLNSHEALLSPLSLGGAACAFAYGPTDSESSSHAHRYMVAKNQGELEKCVEIAREWIFRMHEATNMARVALFATDTVIDEAMISVRPPGG